MSRDREYDLPPVPGCLVPLVAIGRGLLAGVVIRSLGWW